jgi:hypothetical protein
VAVKGGAPEEEAKEAEVELAIGARPGEEVADTALRLGVPVVVLEASQWIRREQAERRRAEIQPFVDALLINLEVVFMRL